MKVHNQLKKIIKNVFKDDDTKSSILSSLNKDDEEDEVEEEGDDDSGDEDIEEEINTKEEEGEDSSSDKHKSSEAKIRTYSSAVLYLNVLAERLTDRFTRAAYTISYSSNIQLLTNSVWEHKATSSSIKIGVDNLGVFYIKKHILDNNVFKYVDILPELIPNIPYSKLLTFFHTLEESLV